MLDKNDKQWLTELFDTRFEEQDAKLNKKRQRMRSQYECMLEALDKHAEMLREESDARFETMQETVDRRFEKQNKSFAFPVDNRLSKLDALIENPTGDYQSYDRLEKRIAELERRMEMLERTVSDHLQEA